jgi:3'(2'), 5'-bisphosphate nucleotidase
MTAYENLLQIAIKAALEAGSVTRKYYFREIEVTTKIDKSPLTIADLESNRVIEHLLRPTNIKILSEESKQIPYEIRKDWQRFWLVDPLDGTKEFINKSSEYTVNIALIENGEPVLGVVFAPVLHALYFGYFKTGSYKCDTKKNVDVDSCINHAIRMQLPEKLPEKLRIIASKSHMDEATSRFIDKLAAIIPLAESKSYGSSLKLCMIADGEAEVYPRMGPTMEWDTAAAHAVALFAGCSIITAGLQPTLQYNKQNLLNPGFVVAGKCLEATIRQIME